MSRPIAKPRRILVVAMDNLGDLVFTASLTPPLRHAFPDAAIDVWCKAYTEDVARLIPYVHRVIAADPPWAVHPLRDRPPIRAFLESLRAVRRERYDVALLTGAQWRVAAAVWACRIPVRIGGARHRNAPFLTHRLSADDNGKPASADHLRLLTPLDIAPPDDDRYALEPTRLGALRQEIAGRLPPSFVALHPFAGGAEKRSALQEWVELGVALRQRGEHIVWCGTRGELEPLRALVPGTDAFVDRLHSESLATTAAVLSLAKVFAGHDSGPLHLAASFGVPVVDVFIGGNPARYGPHGVGRSVIVRAATPAEVKAPAILQAVDALLLGSAAS